MHESALGQTLPESLSIGWLALRRSSFLGTGAFSAHWTGDSASTWQDLRWQVNAVLAPGLAGISFAGADICGKQPPSSQTLRMDDSHTHSPRRELC